MTDIGVRVSDFDLLEVGQSILLGGRPTGYKIDGITYDNDGVTHFVISNDAFGIKASFSVDAGGFIILCSYEAIEA